MSGAACPLCAEDAGAPVVERHGIYAMRLCPTCDLQYADPLEEAPPAFYDTDPLYGGPEAAYTSPWLLNWDQRCFLADHPCPRGTLLDVGCGTGYFAAAAQRAGYRAVGLDVSRVQLEVARRRFGLTALRAATLEEYARAERPASFDVLTAFQVLEHVADPLGFLAASWRLLVPGGFLAVGVPGWRAWRALRDARDAPPNHLTRWSPASLGAALARAGFEPVRLREERSAYNFLLRNVRLGLLRRVMRRRAAGLGGPPAAAVVAASIAKVGLLRVLDAPLGLVLGAVRAPGVTIYALARRPA